jgi:hypothetical protein
MEWTTSMMEAKKYQPVSIAVSKLEQAKDGFPQSLLCK